MERNRGSERGCGGGFTVLGRQLDVGALGGPEEGDWGDARLCFKQQGCQSCEPRWAHGWAGAPVTWSWGCLGACARAGVGSRTEERQRARGKCSLGLFLPVLSLWASQRGPLAPSQVLGLVLSRAAVRRKVPGAARSSCERIWTSDARAAPLSPVCGSGPSRAQE